MEIITDTNILCERANEIHVYKDKKTLKEALTKIKKIMLNDNTVVALAAPQVGYPIRVFCINFDGDIRTFINPVIVETSGLELIKETNKSLPNRTFLMPRHESVVAIYQTGTQKPESNRFVEYAGQLFQQMVQLLDGVLISDIGLEIDQLFEDAPIEEQMEVIDLYMETIKEINTSIQEEINNDKELKQMNDAIKYMEGIQTGKIKTIPLDKKEKKKKKK